MDLGKHTVWFALAAAAILAYVVFFRQGGSPATIGPSSGDLALATTIQQGNAATALATIQAKTDIVKAAISGQTTVTTATLEEELGLAQTQAAQAIAASRDAATVSVAQAAANSQVESARLATQAVEQKNSQSFFGNLISTVLPFFHF